MAGHDDFNVRIMNRINTMRPDMARIRNIMKILVLNPIFFTFATVMCDFLNRDGRFSVADSTNRLDPVVWKFSRTVSGEIQISVCQYVVFEY